MHVCVYIHTHTCISIIIQAFQTLSLSSLFLLSSFTFPYSVVSVLLLPSFLSCLLQDPVFSSTFSSVPVSASESLDSIKPLSQVRERTNDLLNLVTVTLQCKHNSTDIVFISYCCVNASKYRQQILLVYELHCTYRRLPSIPASYTFFCKLTFLFLQHQIKSPIHCLELGKHRSGHEQLCSNVLPLLNLATHSSTNMLCLCSSNCTFHSREQFRFYSSNQSLWFQFAAVV